LGVGEVYFYQFSGDSLVVLKLKPIFYPDFHPVIYLFIYSFYSGVWLDFRVLDSGVGRCIAVLVGFDWVC